MCTGVCRCPQSPGEGVECQGLGVAGNCELPMWMLGTDLESSIRIASAFNHGTIPPATLLYFLMDNHKYLGWGSRLSKVNIRKISLAFAVSTVPSHFSNGFTEDISMYEQVCICDWNFSIWNPCIHCAIIYLKNENIILLFKLMFFYYPRFRTLVCAAMASVYAALGIGLHTHWATLSDPHPQTLMQTTSYLKVPSIFAETCTAIVVLLLDNIISDHTVPPWLEHILSHMPQTVGNSKCVFTV